MEIGSVVEKKSVLLGQEKACGTCGGKTQAARLATTTSHPKHTGVAWGRYCPICNRHTPLNENEIEQAKADYRAKHPACAVA